MATTTQTMESKREGMPLAGWVVLIILVLAGLAAWIYQLIAGVGVTGLNQQVVWGLYIAAFFTTAAAGAGLLALVGLSEFHPFILVTQRSKALMMALVGFILTGLVVILDVGNPLQLWRMVTGFRFTAVMTWDFWALVVASVFTLVYIWASRKPKEAGKSYKALGVLAIIVAVTMVAIEALMLADLAARPMWGGMTIFAFLVGAAIAGLGLAMLILPGEEGMKLSSWLAAALVVSLFLVFAEVLSGLATSNPRTAEQTRSLLVGTASPFFWLHVLVGLILPLVLIWSASTRSRTGLVGALALLGVLAEKTWLLAAGQAQPWLALPEGRYFPTWVEYLAVIGVIALGVLLYMGAVRLTQPKPEAEAAS